MLRNEDIQIHFEEGELINKYLKSIEDGVVPEKPLNFCMNDDGDSDGDIIDIEEHFKAYIHCNSCKLDVFNFCPRCGSLDIESCLLHFKCSDCTYKFSPQEMIYQHKQMCESRQSDKLKYVSLPRYLDKSGDQGELVECPFCKKFESKASLYYHIKECAKENSGKKKTQIPICISFNKEDYLKATYTCADCNMKFIKEVDFKRHCENHKRLKRYGKVTDKNKFKLYIATKKEEKKSTNLTGVNNVKLQPNTQVQTIRPIFTYTPILQLTNGMNPIPSPVQISNLNLSVDPRCTYSIFQPGKSSLKTYNRKCNIAPKPS